jgi:cation:H+ antiporter
MLTTLAMFVTGAAVLAFARGGRRPTELAGDRRILRQDLAYFLVMYALALLAGIVHNRVLDWVLAAVLLAGYGVYVYRHFRSPGEVVQEMEAESGLKPLHFKRWSLRLRDIPLDDRPPRVTLTVAQTLVALVGIVGGARLFVTGVDTVASAHRVQPLVLALLLAPLATELPEKFNSVIWVRRRKDTLALGNLTGAMVFQSSFPVTIGLLLTPWRFTGPGNLDSLVAACVALLAGFVLWLTLRIRGRFEAKLLLAQGVFYVGFVVFVLVRL